MKSQFTGTSIYILLKEMIKMESRYLEEFIEETSYNLELKISNIESQFKELDKSLEDYHIYEDFLIDDYWKYDKNFRKFTYNSMLLYSYGFFENWLVRLCKYGNRIVKSPKKFNDFKGGSYISKSEKYFNEILDIETPLIKENEIFLDRVRDMRNLITHNNSNIKNDKKEIDDDFIEFLNENQNISFKEDKGEFFILNKNFILEFLEIIINILKEICDHLFEKSKIIKK